VIKIAAAISVNWFMNIKHLLCGFGGVTLSRSLILGTGLVCSVEDKFKLGLSEIGELSATNSGSELVTRDDFKF
jgi:hypothetical protein